MNIKQVARLLNDIGQPMIVTDTYLEPDVDYGENYYKLRLNSKVNKWEFLFMERERQSSGGENLEKSFDDEASASKYYYLHELSTYYLFNYIQPFKLNNKDINFSSRSFNLENLKEAFKRLDMDASYYSLDGTVKEHSMLLERVNKKESRVYFIGRNGKEIDSTLILENWEIYSEMYQSVYFLYLLDQHYADLIKSNEIGHIFTDEDYKTLIDGR